MADEQRTAEMKDVQRRLEELAATVTGAIATANTQLDELNGMAKKAAAHSASIQAAADVAATAETFRTQAESAAQQASARSGHVEQGAKYVDEKRSEIDALLQTAQQSVAKVEAAHVTAASGSERIDELAAKTLAVKASADANAESIVATRAAADANGVAIAKLSQLAAATEAKIGELKTILQSTIDTSVAQQKTIEELLLGATNAGLASAFDNRRKTFETPIKAWNAAFIASLAGLLLLAIVEAIVLDGKPTWEELARLMVQRVPFIVPLIWLAIYSSRQSSMAKRMEEEYAFKATISTSFEGYRRLMEQVGSDVPSTSPLSRLCADTLATISSPPGQIYDGRRMDPTPATAAAELVQPLVDGATRPIVKAQ